MARSGPLLTEATVAGLGGAGRLAESLAGVSERVERTITVERIVFG